MRQMRTKTTRSTGRFGRLTRIYFAAVVVALLLLWGYPHHAEIELAPGDLDPGFGANGIAVTQCPGEDAMFQALAVQPDGKIVAAGFVDPALTALTPTSLVMARYNPNGSLDATFGSNGMVTAEHFAAFGVSIQPDGKLVLAGLSNASGPIQLFAVARFNSNGAIDSSFGTGGKVLTDFGGAPIMDANGAAFTALVLPNGKIVAGGTISKADGREAIGLVRYNSDGTLDPSFGIEGKVSADFSHPNAAARAFKLQPDGKIVVAGSIGTNAVTWSDFYQPDDPSQDFVLARFNADGSLDAAFGNEGLVTTDFFGNTDGAFALDIRPNGKMIAAGAAVKTWDRDSTDFAIVRYNANGSLDASFGGGTGKVTADFASRSDLAYAVLAQPDGKVIAAGSARLSPFTHNIALVRFNRDGTPDAGFGLGGKVTTAYPAGQSAIAYAAAFEPEGHIIAAGFGADISSDSDVLMLACYNRGLLEGDFSVLADTQSQTVTAGSSTAFTLNVQAITDPPVASVNLSAETNPPSPGITTSFAPSAIGAGASSVLTVATSSDTQAGSYAITILGAEEEMFKTTTVTLIVLAGSDFALAFDSPTVIGERGFKKKIRVNINRTGGFTGSVTVTPPDLSAEGIVTQFNEPITTADATAVWRFKLKVWAQSGPHVLKFTAQDTTGRVRSAEVTLMLE